ncbi:MAG: TIGR03986 family CRISPR-associated RAMP protein [Bacteroidales bacterium]|nr:TIGR03986 family CRISPR-associated RAMP protein [Bacteroidales bacterium]
MATIKAPYNFVPASKQIVEPWWSNHVNHDVPFRDGLSGEFTVRMKARSPLFVCDGMSRKDKEELKKNSQPLHAAQFRNKYFIPGSSIKGMIRNVLEIMSFSGMSNISDDRYAYRDMQNKEEYRDQFKDQRAGWLYQENGAYKLSDCGEPGRISHKDLDSYFHTDFSEYFSQNGGFNQKNDSQKAARFKYERFKGERHQKFLPVDSKDPRKKFVVHESGEKEGTIVFTGQPGPRKKGNNGKWTGHHLEFVFFNPVHDPVAVPGEVIKNFKFAYHDQDKHRWSEDWEYWREVLENGNKIPVFFRQNDNGSIRDMGLSYLYKLSYKKSVKEALPHNPDGMDLAKTIFGYTTREKALKGRVHFGHAKAANKIEVAGERNEVLAGPKASYYPTYIRQDVKNGTERKFYTFDNGEIAGWKKYPVHKSGTVHYHTDMKTLENQGTRFVPLKEGAEFECRVSYHNLKTIELGALLSAITFHNTPGVYHSLGMARPLGYGKVQTEVTGIDIRPYIASFEAFMNVQLGYQSPTWHKSPQVCELITMASDQENKGLSELKYMKMDPKGNNEFIDSKKNKEALESYSTLEGIQKKEASTAITGKDITAASEDFQKDRTYYGVTDVNEQIDSLRETVSKEILQILESKRSEMLRDLKTRKEHLAEQEQKRQAEIEAERKRKEKAERAKKVKEEGLDCSHVDFTKANAWNELKKYIQRFTCTLHKDNNYDRLKAAHPEGVLPAEFHEDLVKCIMLMIPHLKKSELKKWQQPYDKNPGIRKTAEWIGEKEAKIIIKKIQHNE